MTTPIANFDPSSLRELLNLTNNGVQGLNQPDTGPASFKDMLVQSIGHVNDMQKDADAAVETLMTGGDINPAEVMTAVQKADMSFRLMQQVRNKLVDAYREIQDVRI